MLRLGKEDPKPETLKVGEQYTVKKSNVRIYLQDMAMLLLSEDWTVLGFCAVKWKYFVIDVVSIRTYYQFNGQKTRRTI